MHSHPERAWKVPPPSGRRRTLLTVVWKLNWQCWQTIVLPACGLRDWRHSIAGGADRRYALRDLVEGDDRCRGRCGARRPPACSPSLRLGCLNVWSYRWSLSEIIIVRAVWLPLIGCRFPLISSLGRCVRVCLCCLFVYDCIYSDESDVFIVFERDVIDTMIFLECSNTPESLFNWGYILEITV